MGAVCHTINPRLPAHQMTYIFDHAQDAVLFVDLSLVPIVEDIAPTLPEGIRIVVMTDAAHMPESALDLMCFEELFAAEAGQTTWLLFPETTAAGPS